jgi:probable F420-dependent oxidoreductase
MDMGVWTGNTTVASAEYMGPLADAAEVLGYDSIWVSDHVVWPKQYEPVYPYGRDGRYPGDENTPLCEALVSLAWLSARTTRVRVGSCVVVAAQREPWLLAKQLSSIDHLNHGRTVLGIGLGWMREEFDVLGAPFDDRAARTEEAVSLFRSAWTNHPTKFEGGFWQSQELGVLPHPAQQPIPILLGGNSRGSLRRVAAYGDGWLPFGLGPEEITAGRATIAELAQEHGRSAEGLRTVLWAPLLLGETNSPMVPLHGGAQVLIDTLNAYAKAGVDEFIMFNLAPPNDMVDQLGAFAQQVLPAVQGR